MRSKRLIVAFIVFASSAAIVGCSPKRAERPDRALVTGKVTFHGKELPGGIITFIATSGGNTASAMIKPDGVYTIQEAPIGDNHVTIDTEAIGPELGSRYVKLPEKYMSVATSELKFDVKPGDNKADFALEGE